MKTHRTKLRQAAGVSQVEAAVRAGVSPPLVRAYERFGAPAVTDPGKLARIVGVFRQFELDASKRAA